MLSVTLITFAGLVIVMLLAEVCLRIFRRRKSAHGFDAPDTFAPSGQSGDTNTSSETNIAPSSDAGHSYTPPHTSDFGGHHGGFDGGGGGHGGH